MSRKKKIEEVVVEKDIEQEDNVEIYLSSEELYKLLYLDLKIKNYELARRLETKELDEQLNTLRKKIEEVNKIAVCEIGIAQKELIDLRDKIESKYQIKIADCSFDEQTGRLTVL